MRTYHLLISFAGLVILVLGSLRCSARERVLNVGEEELRFTSTPERGYVVKLRQGAVGFETLSGRSAFDRAQARPIRGLDRHGLWTVENAGPAARNLQTMAVLKQQAAVSYVAPLFSANGEPVAVLSELVVRTAPGVTMQDVQRLCQGVGCTMKRPMGFTSREYLLDVPGADAEAVFAAAEMLNQCPLLEWACPNTAVHAEPAGQVVPNDDYFPVLWHLHNTGLVMGTADADINAPEAWEITTGDPNIVVAVLDSGVEMNHPDLIDNMVPGYDFYEDDALPEAARAYPVDTHGTACAGLIAGRGNNTLGVAGVTWGCSIMPIRLWEADSDGTSLWVTWVDRAEAFRWAAGHGADILSCSWGSASTSPVMDSAIADITAPGGLGRHGRGCVVVAAAHNHGERNIRYPARHPDVIAIGATDANDRRWAYSNFGPELDLVGPSGPDLPDAPGLPVWTTDITGDAGFSASVQVVLARLFEFFGFVKDQSESDLLDYSGFGGTSGATPIVAGVAALVLSVEPDLTNEEVRRFLACSSKDLGDPGPDAYYGWGRVDARAALDAVLARRADLNDDGVVDIDDLLILIDFYGTDEPLADIAPAARPDGIVDELDLRLLMTYWQIRTSQWGAAGAPITCPLWPRVSHARRSMGTRRARHTPDIWLIARSTIRALRLYSERRRLIRLTHPMPIAPSSRAPGAGITLVAL